MVEERQGRIPNVQYFVQSILNEVTNLQHSSHVKKTQYHKVVHCSSSHRYPKNGILVSEYHVLRIRLYQIMRLCINNREFTIYDAPARRRRARQKLWIIRGPRGILNRVVILNTTLNKHYYVFQATRKLNATQEVLLKVEITANIASL